MKHILIKTNIIFIILSFILLIGYSNASALSLSNKESNKVQIIFGWDVNKFAKIFPNSNQTAVLADLAKNGVTCYGIDSLLGPKMTGTGLNFSQCDNLVPYYLDILPAGINPIMPVSSYNWDRWDATYKYFNAKGWLDKRQWLVFKTDVADESRYRKLVPTNNAEYVAFHKTYPKVKWITTDTVLPVLPSHTGILQGDIIIPQAHHEVIERSKYTSYIINLYYRGKEKGIYEAGSFAEFNDSVTIKPGYYENVLKSLGVKYPYPYVPLYTTDAVAIKPYCNKIGVKYFLHWAGWEWFVLDNSGQPVLRHEGKMLLS